MQTHQHGIPDEHTSSSSGHYAPGAPHMGQNPYMYSQWSNQGQHIQTSDYPNPYGHMGSPLHMTPADAQRGVEESKLLHSGKNIPGLSNDRHTLNAASLITAGSATYTDTLSYSHGPVAGKHPHSSLSADPIGIGQDGVHYGRILPHSSLSSIRNDTELNLNGRSLATVAPQQHSSGHNLPITPQLKSDHLDILGVPSQQQNALDLERLTPQQAHVVQDRARLNSQQHQQQLVGQDMARLTPQQHQHSGQEIARLTPHQQYVGQDIARLTPQQQQHGGQDMSRLTPQQQQHGGQDMSRLTPQQHSSSGPDLSSLTSRPSSGGGQRSYNNVEQDQGIINHMMSKWGGYNFQDTPYGQTQRSSPPPSTSYPTMSYAQTPNQMQFLKRSQEYANAVHQSSLPSFWTLCNSLPAEHSNHDNHSPKSSEKSANQLSLESRVGMSTEVASQSRMSNELSLASQKRKSEEMSLGPQARMSQDLSLASRARLSEELAMTSQSRMSDADLKQIATSQQLQSSHAAEPINMTLPSSTQAQCFDALNRDVDDKSWFKHYNKNKSDIPGQSGVDLCQFEDSKAWHASQPFGNMKELSSVHMSQPHPNPYQYPEGMPMNPAQIKRENYAQMMHCGSIPRQPYYGYPNSHYGPQNHMEMSRYPYQGNSINVNNPFAYSQQQPSYRMGYPVSEGPDTSPYIFEDGMVENPQKILRTGYDYQQSSNVKRKTSKKMKIEDDDDDFDYSQCNHWHLVSAHLADDTGTSKKRGLVSKSQVKSDLNPVDQDASDQEKSIKPSETIFSYPIQDSFEAIMNQYILMERRLCEKLREIQFQKPVAYIYNPLIYAFETHLDFVRKFYTSPKSILFLGMNPGPFGMVQNGVPFGEVGVVNDWLGLKGRIFKPGREHPKRPLMGLSCHRSEVSGSRFWGFFKKYSKTPDNFFKNCMIHNLCPLAFMARSGRNLTPPDLCVVDRNILNQTCGTALLELIEIFNIQTIIAIGRYVEGQAQQALKNGNNTKVKVHCLQHPSPLNPQANKGWDSIAYKTLHDLDLLQHVMFDSDSQSSV